MVDSDGTIQMLYETILADESRSSRSQGVLAQTVTVGHPNYYTFGTIQITLLPLKLSFMLLKLIKNHF